MWSEIAYFLDVHGARLASDGLQRWLEPGGHLVSVHYLGDTDYPRTGESIGVWLDRFQWLTRYATYREVAFEAGVWQHPSAG